MNKHRAPRRVSWLSVLLGLLFAALAALVELRWDPLLDLDSTVSRWAYDTVSGQPVVLAALRVIAVVLEPAVLRVLLLALAVWMYVRGARRTPLWLAVSVLGSLLAVWAAKNSFRRPRPDFEPAIATAAGYSFPSGHALGGGMAASALIVLTLVLVERRFVRRLLVSLWCALAVVVALDRVLLTVHYAADVVGGLLLGSFVTVTAAAAIGGVGTDLWPRPSPRNGSEPERRRLLGVILNPTKVEDADVFKNRVSAAAAAAGWRPPVWFQTTAEDAGAGMAADALAGGVDVVAVAGGDGTVRIACGELAGTGTPVGIIPTGTGNLLARNLGLPMGIDAALAVVLDGVDRPVDIVRVDGDDLPESRFVVMAGLGLDAAIMAGAPEAVKARVGWPAYVFSALRHVRYPAVRVDIRVDDEPGQRFRARTVVVGNVGTLQAGIPLLPDASIDDGRLDVVVIAPRRSLGWLGLFWRVLMRRPRTDSRLGRMTGHRVHIEAAHGTPRQLDGDIVAPGRELRAQVEPGVLLVRVPHGERS
jgi:diacylglycerol kinase family enzyme/membrane-associated phospholipid phosphatase